jgi:hypothetical protein
MRTAMPTSMAINGDRVVPRSDVTAADIKPQARHTAAATATPTGPAKPARPIANGKRTSAVAAMHAKSIRDVCTNPPLPECPLVNPRIVSKLIAKPGGIAGN